MQIDAVPDALWPRLSEFIAENTGLHFPPERRVDLQRGLTGAAAELGFADAVSCANWLLSTSLTQSQLHALVSHLTIGETYFFREKKTFDALAGHILPELIRRRRGREQRLRLWSAACATGEEAYSLAILLRQLLPDWQDWHVTILATDINERFLQKAITGIYGEWSFRESLPGFKDSGGKERYFTRTPEGRFAVVPEIKNCVSFEPMNLAQDGFPSLATHTNAMDVILCRNVLIYFAPLQARRLVKNLRSALRDEGWLIVGSSECSQALFSEFVTVNFPGAILYRRCDAREQTVKRPIEAPLAAWAPDLEHLPAEPAEELTPIADAPQSHSSLARTLANQGELTDALASSKRWIATDKLNPAAHYLHAMILQELGKREPARHALQRAIYLQPEFALAHFALGNLARGEAQSRAAEKHFSNALHLLRALPPQVLLPESEGMTAGRLTEIISALIAIPPSPLSSFEGAAHENSKR